METATVNRYSTKRDRPADWSWSDGIGFLPLEGREIEYDHAYFENYKRLAHTEMGFHITRMRIQTVMRWLQERGMTLVDVGIGCGQFLEHLEGYLDHAGTPSGWHLKGTDVNPEGIDWLKFHNMWAGDLANGADALTFWDVLEHIPQPQQLFNRYNPTWIFCSMPIYHNEQHVFRSKHYKPGEHCWYFTDFGLRRFMQNFGYVLVEMSALEIIRGGREDVWTFVFKRQVL